MNKIVKTKQVASKSSDKQTVAKSSAPKKSASPVKSAVKSSAPKKSASPVKSAVKSSAPKKSASPVKSASSLGKGALSAYPAREHSLKKVKLLKSEQKMFRDLLLEARSLYSSQIKFHADEALTSRKGRAGMATHMADLGSDNFRHDFELGLMSDEADVMEMIDESLQRLDDSEYGICLECGARIPNERLKAKPYARYCVKCKSVKESLEDPYSRRR